MSHATLGDIDLMVVVEDGAPEEEWLEGRARGVTASIVHAIAAGSRKTWRRILDDQLNGSTFNGNQHTRRGHAREPYILAEARSIDGVAALAASHALFGAQTNPLHLATPDGLGIHQHLGEFGAEAKSHEAGWTYAGIPADHFDQMQWGMHVTGFSWWLYAWCVEDIDGIQHEWVARDDKRITQLVNQADAYLEWRAAGAPEIDDIPDDVDDAIADYARGLTLEAQGRKLKASARARIDEFTAAQTSAPGEPLRKTGSRAQLFFEPKPDVTVLDEEAWSAAEPETYAAWKRMQSAVAETVETAILLYRTTRAVPATFRITPNGDKA